MIELPDDLDMLSSLQTLSVSSNALETLPDCLVTMTRFLTLYVVPFRALCPDLDPSCLCSLQFIYANGNKISAAPEGLARLPALKVSSYLIHLCNCSHSLSMWC